MIKANKGDCKEREQIHQRELPEIPKEESIWGRPVYRKMLRMKQTRCSYISGGRGTGKSLVTLLRQLGRCGQQPAEGVEVRTEVRSGADAPTELSEGRPEERSSNVDQS